MEPSHVANANNHRNESIVELIRGIFQDTFTLSAKELLAAKLEAKQEVTKALKAGISFLVGGFVLAMGVVLLSLMLVLLLYTYTALALWASFGVFGLVYAIVGAALLWGAAHKARDVKPYPEESVESAKEDVRYVTARAAGH